VANKIINVGTIKQNPTRHVSLSTRRTSIWLDYLPWAMANLQ
jgi:hypothetical protein